MKNRLLGAAVAGLYIGTILFANYLVAHFGIIEVGALAAPAAVLAVGLAFTARDLTQDLLGRGAVLACIVVGTILSYAVSPAFAVASAAAFAASELADLVVYTPLRERGWLRAVTASNIVGSVVDSTLFLWLAFGSFAFLEGQIVGKLAMTALAVTLLGAGRKVAATA